MLNDRKKQILQAIIEEYIQTAEPVSSNAIVQKYNLDYIKKKINVEIKLYEAKEKRERVLEEIKEITSKYRIQVRRIYKKLSNSHLRLSVFT